MIEELVEDAARDAEIQEIVRKRAQLTFAQLLIGLVAEGWITEAEGNDWLVGTLPDPINSLILTLPEEQRFAAKARSIRPSIILRQDPLVISLGNTQGKSAEELDNFFMKYLEA
jgi:hypothetical protein